MLFSGHALPAKKSDAIEKALEDWLLHKLVSY